MATDTLVIERNFPGGNIVVDSIAGDTVTLRQDRAETSEWWFYWCYRVRGAAGRKVRFVFSDGDVFAALGPACSGDGVNWRWLGRACVQSYGAHVGFEYQFGVGETEMYFAFSLPYVQTDLARFLARHGEIQTTTLCQSEQGRAVELMCLPSRQGTYKLPLTARTHACEAMANYVLEGIFEHALGEEPTSAFLREHVDLVAVPFVDKDGVERGEQGKCRRPHDHNRDWTDSPRYATVRAVQQVIPAWRGVAPVTLDLHCPWIRAEQNETIFFVGPPPPHDAELYRLAEILEASRTGELRFRADGTYPFGDGWNKGTSATCGAYMRQQVARGLAATLEVSYALADGQTVTADNARALGRDVGRALALYIWEWEGRGKK